MKTLITPSTRKYLKYISVPASFTQPVLSANGTMGGASFAVEASTNLSDNPAWKAYNNDTGSAWVCAANHHTGWTTFYNPSAIKVSKISCYSSVSSYPKSGKVLGSNNNSSWTELCSWSNGVQNSWYDITVNSSNYYKYYKVQISASYTITATGFNSIKITAEIMVQSVTAGTAEDYDYYVDLYSASAAKDAANYYAVN